VPVGWTHACTAGRTQDAAAAKAETAAMAQTLAEMKQLVASIQEKADAEHADLARQLSHALGSHPVSFSVRSWTLMIPSSPMTEIIIHPVSFSVRSWTLMIPSSQMTEIIIHPEGHRVLQQRSHRMWPGKRAWRLTPLSRVSRAAQGVQKSRGGAQAAPPAPNANANANAAANANAPPSPCALSPASGPAEPPAAAAAAAVGPGGGGGGGPRDETPEELSARTAAEREIQEAIRNRYELGWRVPLPACLCLPASPSLCVSANLSLSRPPASLSFCAWGRWRRPRD
jgi:hypothetical protein